MYNGLQIRTTVVNEILKMSNYEEEELYCDLPARFGAEGEEESEDSEEEDGRQLLNESVEAGGTQQAAHPVKKTVNKPQIFDAGVFSLRQGEHDISDVKVVAANVLKAVAMKGYATCGTSAITRTFVTLCSVVAQKVISIFGELFYDKTKTALTEGTVIQFFICIMVIGMYGTNPTAYFKDRSRGDDRMYMRIRDCIDEKDFMCLWDLMNLPDKLPSQSGIPTPFAGSARLKDVNQCVVFVLRKLAYGVEKLIVCYDDLMLAARSRNMNDSGYQTTANPKKQAGYGFTLDIGTFSVLRIVVSVVFMDNQDNLSGSSRADLTKSSMVELASFLCVERHDVFVILDRGYETEARVLADELFQILATSQKGSSTRFSTPFTYDVKRQLSANANTWRFWSTKTRRL